MSEDSHSAWSKLPIDLQEQFYGKVEQEARSLIKVLQESGVALEEAKPKIRPYIHASTFGTDTNTKIGAVDGSFSPRASERIGGRFAVYSAGFLMLKDKEITDEGYWGDDFRQDQSYPHPLFTAGLQVIESEIEKEASLRALEKNPDLLLVDGGFLGFAYSLFKIRKETSVPDWLEKRAQHALEMTYRLLDSGKCAGVVKRGRSRAIGGWLSMLARRRSPLVRYLDKQILYAMMSPPSVLDYAEILGRPGFHRTHTRISELLDSGRTTDPIEAMEEAKFWAVNSMAKALGTTDERKIRDLESRINRIQIRVSGDAPPFELELAAGSEDRIMRALFSSSDNFNRATGLPIAIDLVDEYVSLPMEFTKEFVTEVEARLAQMYEGDLNDVKGFFSNMNPQKES